MTLTAACMVSETQTVCNERLFNLLIELCIDLKGTIGKTISVSRIFTELYGSVWYRGLCFDIMHAKISIKSLSLPAVISLKASGNYDLTLIYTQQIRELLILTLYFIFPQAKIRDGGHCSP